MTGDVNTEKLDGNGGIQLVGLGLPVNGPGEARECDIGIAGGDGEGLLFRKGEIVRKIKEDRLVCELVDEIRKMGGAR